jgi:lycopene beta-cyclase
MSPLSGKSAHLVETSHGTAVERGAPYDLAFAGTGLAALSLAVRLVDLPNPPRMVLIDPRTVASRDRTWCHWQLHDHPFTEAISHRWNDWTVSFGSVSTTIHSAAHPYVRIPSDRLYRAAIEKLSSAPTVAFLQGVSVTAITERPDQTVLHLSDGRKLSSAWAFDSRPPEDGNAPWRQIFRGLELHATEATFDRHAVTLMDFHSASPAGIRFFYVLPLANDTALVEDTWLVPADHTPTFSDEDIINYARTKLGTADWQIRHREEGNLPMGLRPAKAIPSPTRNPSRVIRWGTPGGAVRASSGYAFSRIQRASKAMAEHWARNACPSPFVSHESSILTWMDRVFLRVMDLHPERVPEFFLRLFQRVPAESLIRFLESEPRNEDLLRVMKALPPLPFLSAAIR